MSIKEEADIWRYGRNDVKQKRTYTFGSNFNYLIFSLISEKFPSPLHPKTVKVKCLRKIYYLRMPTSNVRGGRSYKSCGCLSWTVQTHLNDGIGMSC